MRRVLCCFVWLISACASPATPPAASQAGALQADAADGQSAAAGDVSASDLPAAVSAAEYVATAADFDCIKNGTKVGHIYVDNKLGHLAEAVEAAKSGTPGVHYPLGTVIRLFPLEAMVKRGGSAFAATRGWEMFKLKLANGKADIAERGGVELKNAAGACFGCHSAAQDFDLVCGTTHGCAPLGVSEDTIGVLQDADPSCP